VSAVIVGVAIAIKIAIIHIARGADAVTTAINILSSSFIALFRTAWINGKISTVSRRFSELELAIVAAIIFFDGVKIISRKGWGLAVGASRIACFACFGFDDSIAAFSPWAAGDAAIFIKNRIKHASHARLEFLVHNIIVSERIALENGGVI
jgi:hypothetical protein